jgi:hypothetical protein
MIAWLAGNAGYLLIVIFVVVILVLCIMALARELDTTRPLTDEEKQRLKYWFEGSRTDARSQISDRAYDDIH